MKAIQHSASSKKIWIFNNTPAGTSHFTVKYVSIDGKKVIHTECKYYSNGYLGTSGFHWSASDDSTTRQLLITQPPISFLSQNHPQLLITVPPISFLSQNHPQLLITVPPVSFSSQYHPSASHHSTTRQLMITVPPVSFWSVTTHRSVPSGVSVTSQYSNL